jgi:ribonuclease P protein component
LRREQYLAALASGAACTRRHFTLFVRPNGLSQARIGIIASKRVAPRAVDRNRAKRLVRETFRKLRHRLGGVDLVVELRRCPSLGFNTAAAAEMVRMLEELGAQAHSGRDQDNKPPV